MLTLLQRVHMLKQIISLWTDASAFPLLGTFGRDVQLFLMYFESKHYTDGEPARDAAIDAFCAFMQTQKSNGQEIK